MLLVNLVVGGAEGLTDNLIVTGLQTGCIKMWSAWDLSLIRELTGGHKAPVTAITFSNDYTQLISGDETGLVVCWSCKRPKEGFVGPMGL